MSTKPKRAGTTQAKRKSTKVPAPPSPEERRRQFEAEQQARQEEFDRALAEEAAKAAEANQADRDSITIDSRTDDIDDLREETRDGILHVDNKVDTLALKVARMERTLATLTDKIDLLVQSEDPSSLSPPSPSPSIPRHTEPPALLRRSARSDKAKSSGIERAAEARGRAAQRNTGL